MRTLVLDQNMPEAVVPWLSGSLSGWTILIDNHKIGVLRR